MQDYAHTARHRGAYDPELSTRLDAFGHNIEQALRDGYDEVLVVGHSSGAHLGVTVLARLERAGILSRNSPISFLSLGHVVPMVSFLPAATELRSDLKQLGNSDAVTWVDVTAPGDGCSFALCDPVAVSGQGDGTQNGPLVLSAAFIPLPRWMPRFHSRATRRSAARIRNLITELTRQRADQIAAGTAPDDLATKIMTTPDPETGRCFEWREMVDQVAIFFLVGHETSASALAWALYLLAENQDVQTRVAEEVRTHDLDIAGLSKMPLLRGDFAQISGHNDQTWSARACGAFNRTGQG